MIEEAHFESVFDDLITNIVKRDEILTQQPGHGGSLRSPCRRQQRLGRRARSTCWNLR